MAFGRTALDTLGRRLAVSADGNPEFKLGGITIDWTGVTPVDEETTLDDGTVVAVGNSYLRYGQVMALDTGSGLFEPAVAGTLVNGETVVLNETIIRDAAGLLQTDHKGAIEGGRVWLDRILVGGSGEPTLAQLKAALPRLQFSID